jgi:glycosyltransferase involved in cell wall biosynthesis
MVRRVTIQWGVSSYFGWGVYGLNLALCWAADGEIEAQCALEVSPGQITLDPVRMLALAPFVARSRQLQEELKAYAKQEVTLKTTLLLALGNGFSTHRVAYEVALKGKPTIGVTFFEQPLDAEAIERGKRFPLIVTGSRWNEQLLRGYGISRVRTVLQGVDPTHFHPAPRLGVMPDRFLVFSGGKAESRKGQDIVLAAFRIFAERHPDAVLVTAWQNAWVQNDCGLNTSGLVAPVVFKDGNRLDVAAWAAASGIPIHQVVDLGFVPNLFLPSILREMDAALFTNRAEGGTNLVAMECMACGLPVVLSRNTGHLDLIEEGNCYPLADQRPAAGTESWFAEGWGESKADEVVARLEEIYTDRTEARRRGERAAKKLASLTWAETARQMKEIVLEHGSA